MKLMIDISDSTYETIMARDWKNAGWLFSEELRAIHDGTPIPENATNGDMIKAMFPMEGYYGERAKDYYHFIEWNLSEWWNGPYKRGETNE